MNDLTTPATDSTPDAPRDTEPPAPLSPPPTPPAATTTADFLRGLMKRYQTKDLARYSPEQFRSRIDEFLQLSDHAMEGLEDPSQQRDLTINFHWGHDHDFGDFQLPGRMQSRHIELLEFFMDHFGVPPRDFAGKRILDIGCWTGGASLLLAAMGARVVAIDEVRKYVDALDYLRHAFDIQGFQTKNLSLYQATTPDFQDNFDYCLFAGVLYHVSDPVLALRIVFNSLKDGGIAMVETLAIDTPEQLLRYHGPTHFAIGETPQPPGSRGGWNWILPSPSALKQMMIDVGFEDVQVSEITPTARVFAVGTRKKHVDLMRAGLSVRDIR